jgi:antitoxin component HigA of HigAB toxin-antitoxin module
MKAISVLFLSVVIAVLFCACGSPDPSESNANITREQAIQKIESVSSSSGDVDIYSYPDLDKVVDNLKYYFIQVVFPNRMAAEYYVDSNEGNIFVAMGGELDTSNPLSAESIASYERSAQEDGIAVITTPETSIIKDIFDSIGMTVQELEDKFGSGYSKVSVDYNGYMKAYLYSEQGFTAAFNKDGKVARIYCGEKIEIGGARSGMDFAQIQDKLGKTSFRQTWIETPINAAYELEYRYNGRAVVFFSRQDKGANSIMSIY